MILRTDTLIKKIGFSFFFILGCSSSLKQPGTPVNSEFTTSLDPGPSRKIEPTEKAHVQMQGIVDVSLIPESSPSRNFPYYTIKVVGKAYDIVIPHVPVYDLIPRVRLKPEYRHPSMLLQEYERFGIYLDKDENHFRIEPREEIPEGEQSGIPDIRRIQLSNNCLQPGKWELAFYTKYYQDAGPNQAKKKQGYRYRQLGHYWFTVDREFYRDLFQGKNKLAGEELLLPYDSLSNLAERIVLPLEKWQGKEQAIQTEVLEWGHRSKRRIEALDPRVDVPRKNKEQFYKNAYGLIKNGRQFGTYADVLKHPVQFIPFRERGFYLPESTITFDYSWMKKLDDIELAFHSREPRGRYCNMAIRGTESPYAIYLLDFDLAKISGGPTDVAFGADAYPKMRKYRRQGYSNTYKLSPDDGANVPMLWMVDAATGKWVNNQKRGLEKMILQWESPKQEVLRVYLVSYERILSVYMARVKVIDPIFRGTRIHNARYEKGRNERVLEGDPVDIRKQREARIAQFFRSSHKQRKMTLDFESLESRDEKLHGRGSFYFEKGFMLHCRAFMKVHPFYSLGRQSYPSVSGAALVNGNVLGINVLKPHKEHVSERITEKGPYFDVLSIDLGLFSPSAPGQVTLVGVRWDESKVDVTLELPPFPQMKTFQLQGLENLSELRWLSQSVVMDNIVVEKKDGLEALGLVTEGGQ